MREHAKRVPLAAGEHHLRVDEGRTTLCKFGAFHEHGRRTATAGLLLLHQRQRLLARFHVDREQRGDQRLQRAALGAVQHFRRQVFIFEIGDEFAELTAHGHGGYLSDFFRGNGSLRQTRKIIPRRRSCALRHPVDARKITATRPGRKDI
jgi:hypothetical protein